MSVCLPIYTKTIKNTIDLKFLQSLFWKKGRFLLAAYNPQMYIRKTC